MYYWTLENHESVHKKQLYDGDIIMMQIYFKVGLLQKQTDFIDRKATGKKGNSLRRKIVPNGFMSKFVSIKNSK